MKYKVFTSSGLQYFISTDILSGYNQEHFSKELGSFDEVHISNSCPDELAQLGFSHSVELDLRCVKETTNSSWNETRLKRLVGYLDRYSDTFSEAIRVHNLMVVSNVIPTKEFFSHYIEMLDFLGSKMKGC